MRLLTFTSLAYLYNCVFFIGAADDPCLEKNHMFFDDPNALRSSGNSTVPLFHQCDSRMTEGWYRIRSPAGTDIPNKCTQPYACSTIGTIWMDGDIPSDNEIHDRTMYVVTDGNCHDTKLRFTIQVKNCRSKIANFRVYNLKRTQGCPIAYCFGSKMPCPNGTSSENGFEPGCSNPASRTPFTEIPKVDFDVEDKSRELLFVCEWSHTVGYMYDIEWYKKDVMVLKAEDVPVSKHILRESDWFVSGKQNLGHVIYCRVRAQGPKHNHPSMYQISNKYFAGIQVLTPSLEINEGEDASLLLESTVPILCKTKGDTCELALELYSYDEASIIERGCKGGSNAIAIEKTKCGVNMRMVARNVDWKKRWNNIKTKHDKVLVSATMDGNYESSRTMRIIMKSAEVFLYNKIWENYHLDPVNVIVQDKDQKLVTPQKICYSHNDPHLMTFDQCRYEAQWLGEFILYKHKTKPVQVNIFTKTCNGAATCNCAVAVRSGRDVFIISKCSGTFGKNMFFCEDNAMTIHEEGPQNFRIVLPTGTTVKVFIGSFDLFHVDIIPSPLDNHQTEGLCGNFDNNRENDLIYRGEITAIKCENRPPKTFVDSWSVPEDSKESLREGYNNINDKRIFIPLCTCKCEKCKSSDVHAEETAHCGYQEQVNICLQKAGNDLTHGICAEKKRRKRSLYKDNILGAPGTDEPEFRIPPTGLANFADTFTQWRNGWTEEKAKEFCTNTVMMSESGRQCAKLENLDLSSSINDCVADIKITGGTEWAGDAITAMKSGCEEEITKNTTRWVKVPGSNHTVPPPEISETLCPSNCNQHGSCRNGACVCDAAYTAIDCSIKVGEPPIVRPLSAQGLCDLRKKPCESTVLNGRNFLASPNLTCRVDYWKLTSNGIQKDIERTQNLEADYRGFTEVACPLFPWKRPGNFALDNPDNPLALVYHVSVSNENVNFSSPVALMAFDGKCLECSLASYQCILKNDTCRIDGMCYNNGDQHSLKYPCDKCEPTVSVSSWTQQIESCAINGKCYPHGAENQPNKPCQMCNASYNSKSWTLKSKSWCYIDDECVPNGEISEDGCKACFPEQDSFGWTVTGRCQASGNTRNTAAKVASVIFYLFLITGTLFFF